MSKQFEGRVYVGGQRFATWEALIPKDHTPDDIIEPHYWGAFCKDLKPRDVIKCEAEDGTWTCELRVMGTDAHARRVLVAPKGDFCSFPAGPVPQGFKLDFVNFSQGWRVLSGPTDMLIRSGFASAYEAAEWLRSTQPAAPPMDEPPVDNGKSKKVA